MVQIKLDWLVTYWYMHCVCVWTAWSA